MGMSSAASSRKGLRLSVSRKVFSHHGSTVDDYMPSPKPRTNTDQIHQVKSNIPPTTTTPVRTTAYHHCSRHARCRWCSGKEEYSSFGGGFSIAGSQILRRTIHFTQHEYPKINRVIRKMAPRPHQRAGTGAGNQASADGVGGVSVFP